jgi:hypothetical protein
MVVVTAASQDAHTEPAEQSAAGERLLQPAGTPPFPMRESGMAGCPVFLHTDAHPARVRLGHSYSLFEIHKIIFNT